MKKTLKIALAIALMMVMLVTLAGCGKKEEEKKEEPANNTAVVDYNQVIFDNNANNLTGMNIAFNNNTTVPGTDTNTVIPNTTTTPTTNPFATGSNDKIVAYKDIAAGESTMGEIREIIEVTYKNDLPDAIAVKMEFADSNTPASYAALLQSAGDSLEGMTVTAEGNFIVMTMDVKAYMDEEGLDSTDELTKEALIQSLKDEGFTVQ